MKREFIFFLAILIIGAACKKVTDDQAYSGNRVFDHVGILTNDQKEKLMEMINSLEKKKGPQIAIEIIDTLNGEDINKFSLRRFEELNLGRKKYRDGLLITVAYKNREIRIEVGYGLEKIIKDEVAARIIREVMGPKFREQKFYEGLHVSVGEIKKLIEENERLIGKLP